MRKPQRSRYVAVTVFYAVPLAAATPQPPREQLKLPRVTRVPWHVPLRERRAALTIPVRIRRSMLTHGE